MIVIQLYHLVKITFLKSLSLKVFNSIKYTPELNSDAFQLNLYRPSDACESNIISTKNPLIS